MGRELFVIAEAGVNHNGDLGRALELVDVAAEAGADAVKFQTFRAESLVTRSAPLAKYQERSEGAGGGQYELLKRLELDEDAFAALAARCLERGIEFMSTPFDIPSVVMLERIGVRRLKVPSGEATNPALLRAVARTGKPLILSTGMCTLAEVERALSIIAHVLAPDAASPPFWTTEGRALLASRTTVLHCTTEYPAPPSSANLRAMQTLAEAFGVPVGYSDHTEGVEISAAAVALGATVIEKHFTLDRSLPGPDHAASLEARELPRFVQALRGVRDALGTGVKVPQPAELGNRTVARRSLVAARPIAKGELFTEENVALKRPASGIPADRLDEVLGRAASRSYDADDFLEP